MASQVNLIAFDSENDKSKAYNLFSPNTPMDENLLLDYLKDSVGAKQIREAYRRGDDLDKIIVNYSSKKFDSKLITKIYNLIKFEFDEQERFLKTYEGKSRLGLFFYPLTKSNYSAIISATLKGIRDGAQDFLDRENLIIIYKPKLSYFCYDDALKNNVKENVNFLDLKLDRQHIPEYAENIRGRYCGFMYNESREEFRKRFNLR